jgi:transcriptional regulator with XRE-family HTH domain
MRQLREIGAELRERRLSLGESQAFVAAAARLSRSRYATVEAGAVTTLSVSEINRIASVLGLDASIRLFPGGAATRDAAHSGKLGRFLRDVRVPLRARVEVSLPSVGDRFERRAWDAMLFGSGERTAVELEMRLRDVQAMRRRHELKRRDDPTEHFLLLIADTRHNRSVVAEFVELFADLPRLRPSQVRAALGAGRHPPNGMLFV